MTDAAEELEALRSGATLDSVSLAYISATRKMGKSNADLPEAGEPRITLRVAMAVQGVLLSIFDLTASSNGARYNVGAFSIHKITTQGDSTKDEHLEQLAKSFAETDALEDVYPYLRSAVQGLASMLDTDDKLPVSPPTLQT